MYTKIIGSDITKDVKPLIVVDAQGNQTEINDDNLTSVSRARSAYRATINGNALGWHSLKKPISACPMSLGTERL